MLEINEAFKTLNDRNIKNFHEHGYIVIRELFCEEEVKRLRKACSLKRLGDTLGIEDFQEITLSDKVLNIFKKIIPNKIVYPCLSLNRSDDKPITSKGESNERMFHIDSIPDDFNYDKNYKIYNTGIYLSDHKNFSGGLKVRPYSTKSKLIKVDSLLSLFKNILKDIFDLNLKGIISNFKFIDSINLDTKPGDFVIWNHRCHHSGHFRRLKLFPKKSLEPFLENLLPNFLFIKEPESRQVILTVYADETSPYLEEYITMQIKKERRREHYIFNEKLEEKKDKYKNKNIIIRNDGFQFWSENNN